MSKTKDVVETVTPVAQDKNYTATEAHFEEQRQLPSDNVTATETADNTTEVKTLSQKEVDRIIAERVSQTKKKYSDYDTIKAKLAEYETANQTEVEKTTARLAELEKQNVDLANQNKVTKLHSAVTKSASNIGLDIDAALALIDKNSVNEDNSNVDELVRAVAVKYPGLVTKHIPVLNPVNPSKNNEATDRTDDDRRQDYFGKRANGFWSGNPIVMNKNGE